MPESPSLRSYEPLIREKIDQWKSYQKCKRCLLPEKFRDIRFDDQGICNHCTQYLSLTNHIENTNKEDELVEVIERFRKYATSDYDAIVCYSGGKDSSYLLDRFVNTYNLRILAVTMDTGFNSETARQNIQAGISKLGVDHHWLTPKQNLLGLYQYGFLANSGMGLECDVCDLCDGHTRKNVVELALEKNIPMIIHGADHFQLIDSGLNAGISLLLDEDACRPSLAKKRNVFRKLYKLESLNKAKRPPLELYPFLYLPYNEEEICSEVEEKGLVVDYDPDATNCDFIFLINFIEFLRNGYPAYIHNTCSAILQGEISWEDASVEVIEWLEEYLEGTYEEEILNGVKKLGIPLDKLINPGEINPCKCESARGIPIE